MKRSVKIALVVLSSVAAMFLGIFIALTVINSRIPKPLVYPESGLSESIFDSQKQNMKYVEQDGLKGVHSFEKCPYQFDTVKGDVANVGDFGSVYRITDAMYVYATEVANGDSVEAIIKNELSKAVMIDSATEMSVIDNLVYDEGYRNGFKADYYISCLTVSNGARTASVYLTGYLLTITEPKYDHGYKIFLSSVAAVSDTETYSNAKGLLDAMVSTFKYNDETQSDLVKEEERLRRLAEKEAEKEGVLASAESTEKESDSEESTVISTDGGSGSDMASQAVAVPGNVEVDEYFKDDMRSSENNNAGGGEGAASDADIPKHKQKTVTVTSAYEDVTLYYYYANTENDITVILYNPDKSVKYEPDAVSKGSVSFKIDKMEVGKWYVDITGDAGSDSMKLYSETLTTQ